MVSTDSQYDEVVEHHRDIGCRSSGSSWHYGIHV